MIQRARGKGRHRAHILLDVDGRSTFVSCALPCGFQARKCLYMKFQTKHMVLLGHDRNAKRFLR